MRPKIKEEVLTQVFEAATVVADPFVEITDDGEVDPDPTERMGSIELQILQLVCTK